MKRTKKDKSHWDLEPQKASAAQFLTYIASTGAEVYLGKTRFNSLCDILPFQAR